MAVTPGLVRELATIAWAVSGFRTAFKPIRGAGVLHFGGGVCVGRRCGCAFVHGVGRGVGLARGLGPCGGAHESGKCFRGWGQFQRVGARYYGVGSCDGGRV